MKYYDLGSCRIFLFTQVFVKWMRGWEKLGNPSLFFPWPRYPRLLVNNVNIELRITFFLTEVLVDILEHLIGVVF